MAELKGLKIKRGQLKGQVKRFGNFIEAEIEDEQKITVRLERLTAVWESFQNIQYAIRDTRKRGIVDAEGRETQLERIELEEGEEEAAFEDSYFRFVATAKRKIAQVNQVNHVEAGAGAGVMPVFKTSVKLPTITLPTFNGQYSQWIPFKDAFISLIDKNTALSEIQKLQYLRETLKNEALNFIEGLETTAENYRIAWQLLENHYENRRLIINTHLKELFETAPMMKGNRTAIRQFVNHIRMHIKALTTLKLPVDQWDAILIYLATNKLDYYTRKEWETHISTRGVNELPRMEELLEFLISRYHMLEMVEREKSTTESRKPGEKRHDRAVALAATANNECEYCKGTHRIFNCDKLLKLPVASRSKEIKQLKLCLNCLRKGHWSKECRASGCKICKAKHNSLLHLEPEREKEGCAESSQDKAGNVISTHCIKDSQQVLLSTAKVYVFDRKGQQHICRVLLDPGSQSNLITRALVDKLHLACKSVTVPVSGINQSKIHVSQSVVPEMQSRHSKEKYELECLVLGKITERIPQNRVDIAALKISSHFTLADEDFHNPGTIDVLIGAGIFWQIIKDKHEDLLPGQLRMQSTSLGWILGGYLLNPQKGSQTICNMMTNDELSQQLELFWQAEEGSEQKYYSPEEQKCEEHFQGAVQRNEEGRFIVGLPQREDIILADSYTVALKRWYALEGRFERQPEIKQEYIKFMEIYKELEHMSLVEEDKPRVHSDIYYMPHHPVIKNSALTSKLRVVFDASAQSESGVSLNHKLLVGPVLQGTLIDMLLKFRIHQYVLTADLEMMYRQILVREQDRDLQRILWRTSRDEDIQIYRLNTLTYGTASALFLAVRCLKELAMQEGHQYPTAAEVLQKDFYMDYLITGTYTLKEACYLQQELTELLQRGRFRLRKWRSNDKRILHSLEQGKEADEFLVLNKHETLRTLGLLWNSEQDSLQYEIQINGAQAVTKRQVLSLISKIFDPLGIIGPVLIIAKKLMQQLWKEQLEWDQELPYHLHERWKSYYESLNSVKMLSVPRNVNPDNSSRSIDLHIFYDASEKAYGACVYIKERNQNGQESIHLMCSRSRVAPLKSITLPRLELNAAHLAAKLYYNLERVIKSNRNCELLDRRYNCSKLD